MSKDVRVRIPSGAPFYLYFNRKIHMDTQLIFLIILFLLNLTCAIFDEETRFSSIIGCVVSFGVIFSKVLELSMMN